MTMTTGDLLNFLANDARAYRLGAEASIRRNDHMNDATGVPLDQRDIDALLVDFLNFIAAKRCVDFGLYASDLAAPVKLEPQ